MTHHELKQDLSSEIHHYGSKLEDCKERKEAAEQELRQATEALDRAEAMYGAIVDVAKEHLSDEELGELLP